MARRELIDRWRTGSLRAEVLRRLAGVDLRYATLADVHLEDVRFTGCRFDGADLDRADWEPAVGPVR